MKALLSRVPGGPEKLELSEVPDPVAGDGQLLIRVRACAINYPDVLVIEDRYQRRPPRPFSPGGEIAGIVEAIGGGVMGWKAGDRVIAMIRYGGLAEKVVVNASEAFPLPAGRSFEEGSALIMTYATSLHALKDRGRLRNGETLLILGAAGGVGLAAVELGKAMGAHVIGAVSSDEKASVVRKAGADAVLVYPASISGKDDKKALADTFKQVVGATGAHVILDPVGGDYTEAAIRSIAWGGRYLIAGFTAGITKLPLNLPLLKGCDVCGIFWGGFTSHDPGENRKHIETLFRLWDEGKITPRISRIWPLERASDAIAHMATRRAIGKLVVTI